MKQAELKNVKKVWNMHNIRRTRLSNNIIGGRPSTLYALPEIYHTMDYSCLVHQEDFEACIDETITDDKPCDTDVFDLATLYMDEHQWTLPSDAYEALNLYMNIRDCLKEDLY